MGELINSETNSKYFFMEIPRPTRREECLFNFAGVFEQNDRVIEPSERMTKLLKWRGEGFFLLGECRLLRKKKVIIMITPPMNCLFAFIYLK